MADSDTTPVRPEGLVVSEKDYDLISAPLVAMAEEANKHGQTELYTAIKRFVVRLQQAVFNGSGVPEETLQRMLSRVSDALCNNDMGGARVAISAMLAAVVRMDPDPGHTIALNLAPRLVAFVSSVAAVNQGAIAAQTLTDFAARLETEKAAFEEHGWPDKAEDTLDYVHSLASFCAEELQRGSDPFHPEDAGEPN